MLNYIKPNVENVAPCEVMMFEQLLKKVSELCAMKTVARLEKVDSGTQVEFLNTAHIED